MSLQELNNNPVVQARYYESLTQERLGKKLGMSKQYISRAEAATYAKLSKGLVRWVSTTLQLPIAEIEARYTNFQTEVRMATVSELGPDVLSRGNSLAPGHEVFKAWRETYWTSPFKFCTSMCVHPSSVENYEDGIHGYLPELVRYALNEVKLLDPNWTEVAHSKSNFLAPVPGPAAT